MNELTTTSASPSAIITYAMEKGADIEKLEQLFALQQKWEANEARKAYVAAMARFKKNPPTIIKNKEVKFGTTQYMHATLGEVCERIVSALAEHGFSHRWIPTRNEGGMIGVTCVITHELGHSEETSLEAGLDNSGGKNNIQSMISTKTYLERHSLLAATGLATKDMEDDDGRAAGKPTGIPVDQLDAFIARIQATTAKADAKIIWREATTVCATFTDVAAANRLKEVLLAHAAKLDAAADEPAE